MKKLLAAVLMISVVLTLFVSCAPNGEIPANENMSSNISEESTVSDNASSEEISSAISEASQESEEVFSEEEKPKIIPEERIKNDNGSVQITFPVYEDNKTEHNAEYYFNIPPFNLNMTLPQGWEIELPPVEDRSGFWGASYVRIEENGKSIGKIDYSTFELVDWATEENFHRVVFSQYVTNHLNVTYNYSEVKNDGVSCVALSELWCDIGTFGDLLENPIERPCILAYNKDLLVSVDIRFNEEITSENVIPNDVLTEIANSITLTPAE